jgi:hypothetical protein
LVRTVEKVCQVQRLLVSMPSTQSHLCSRNVSALTSRRIAPESPLNPSLPPSPARSARLGALGERSRGRDFVISASPIPQGAIRAIGRISVFGTNGSSPPSPRPRG